MARITNLPLAETSPNRPRLSGSVSVNGVSYSGADIKLIIATPRSASTVKTAIANNSASLIGAQRDLDKTTKDLASVNQKLASQKVGTPGFQRLSNRSGSLRQLRSIQQDVVTELGARGTALNDVLPESSAKVIAEAQTISVSTFRDKQAVRACGEVYPKSFTRGPREISGSIIFTVFNEHVLYEFLEAHPTDFDANTLTSALMDQLPPMDIIISFANEYGAVSRMTLYGIEFFSEGQTMSIEDIITENVIAFSARDLDPMRAVSRRKLDENSIMTASLQPKRASDLLYEEDYQKVKDRLSPFARHQQRSTPFL